MARQNKTKKPECVGKGKVTPVQIAFIVDRYLSDNSFTQTRSSFRSEASHLLAKTSVQEAPKSLLTLGAMLEEYVTLKEKKVLVDRERCRLEQENIRVQNFLKGMQHVMNAYNAGTNNVVTPSPQLPPPVIALGLRAEDAVATPGGPFPMYKSPPMISASMPLSTRTDSNNFSTPVTSHATTKRKGSKDISSDPVILKKSRILTPSKGIRSVNQVSNADIDQVTSLMKSATQSSQLDNTPPGNSQVQGSNVVKCLFNQKPPSPSVNSSVPKTPPQASSSDTEKSPSPSEICSTATFSRDVTPQCTMSTNCTIISSETFQVSPTKQIAYYSIEKNSCISTCSPVKANAKWSNTKDHVKGRLNFDTSEVPVPMIAENQSPDDTSASESDKDGNVLDLDFPIFDSLVLDFNLSEFLLEFDMESGGLGKSSQQAHDSSPDPSTCLPSASGGNDIVNTRQHFPSDITGILGDKDMNLIGPDSITTMRSVTKGVILSPVKRQSSSSDQENTPARN